MINLVELLAMDDNEGGGFNQPCRHGHLVAGHAVYCHNSTWADAPRKCRRSWYTGGDTRDEDCPGFAPNPLPAPSALHADKATAEAMANIAASPQEPGEQP